MHKLKHHPYLVPFDGHFDLGNAPTKPAGNIAPKKKLVEKLHKVTTEIDELQQIFYAHDRHAMLLIFQGIDAAGKDSAIRSILSGINPAGCQVFSFKQPSAEELDHDFLWRTTRCLPERGRIGIFNRSYYEEVLVVRVHPDYLANQKLPKNNKNEDIWQQRYQSIRQHEEHLAHNGTVILKFWLNVSKKEQKKRFLSRLKEPEKHWKFAEGDLVERVLWADYMQAFKDALAATSRPWAPWYAIPADNKAYCRLCIAEIIAQTLQSLDLHYPQVNKKDLARYSEMRQILENE